MNGSRVCMYIHSHLEILLLSLVPRPHGRRETWPGYEANSYYIPYSGKLSREKTFVDL